MREDSKQIKDYPDILDVAQMAQLLGVSIKTGYKFLAESKIAHIRVGHQYRIPKANVMRYLRMIVD